MSEELTYSPNDIMYLLDSDLKAGGQININTLKVCPRIFIRQRGSRVGIQTPLDLFYWNMPNIVRYDSPSSYTAQKQKLSEFCNAINNLFVDGRQKNGIMICQWDRGLVFELMGG